MEKNQVLLAVEEYNELRDFKKEIESGKRLVIIETHGFQYMVKKMFYTDGDILSDFAERNGMLEVENKELVSEIAELAEMSVWEFRKWRKSQAK